MKIILETERLILREFCSDDSKFIVELLNSPGWLEFIGDRNVKTEEEAIQYLQSGPIKSYEINGYGLSLVELKRDHNPIGMCGIIKRDNLENPDIGFAFLPAFMGVGFAFEIANATMNYAMDKLNLKQVLAITVPHNIASRKLLEKIGMEFIRDIYLPGDNEKLLLFGYKQGQE